MGVRRKGRELALQALYLSDLAHIPIERALQLILKGSELEKEILRYAEKISLGTGGKLASLDQVIKKVAQNWEMNRMAALDRNILRMGAYELLYELDVPVSVAIDEAVEIAKTFSTADSGKFVNGILDKIKEERMDGKKPT